MAFCRSRSNPSSKPVLHRAVAGKTGSDLMCALVPLLPWFDVEHACVGTDLERGAVPVMTQIGSSSIGPGFRVPMPGCASETSRPATRLNRLPGLSCSTVVFTVSKPPEGRKRGGHQGRIITRTNGVLPRRSSGAPWVVPTPRGTTCVNTIPKLDILAEQKPLGVRGAEGKLLLGRQVLRPGEEVQELVVGFDSHQVDREIGPKQDAASQLHSLLT